MSRMSYHGGGGMLQLPASNYYIELNSQRGGESHNQVSVQFMYLITEGLSCCRAFSSAGMNDSCIHRVPAAATVTSWKRSLLCPVPWIPIHFLTIYICDVSLTQLQLFQFKHKPVAMGIMYCIEIGHDCAVCSVLIKRRRSTAGWLRWAGSVHLLKGFALCLENGFSIEQEPQHSSTYLNCPSSCDVFWARLQISVPSTGFPLILSRMWSGSKQPKRWWVAVSPEQGHANTAHQDSCCLLASGTAGAEPRAQQIHSPLCRQVQVTLPADSRRLCCRGGRCCDNEPGGGGRHLCPNLSQGKGLRGMRKIHQW